MKKINTGQSAQYLIMVAAFCWGLVGIFSRQLAASGFSSIEMVAGRGATVSLCFVAFLLIFDREKFKIARKDILWLFSMGVIGISITPILYFNSMALIALSAACVLLYTAPYMVIILSAVIFKEKITLQKLSALIIAFTGCVMTVGFIDSRGLSLAGVLSGFAAAFCYALYTIIGKVVLSKYNPITVAAYIYPASTLTLLPFCHLSKMMTLIGENYINAVNLLIMGLVLTLLPTILYMSGLKRLEPGKVSIITFVEPLTAAGVGIIVFDEVLSFIKISGIVLIFLSLLILNLNRKQGKAGETSE